MYVVLDVICALIYINANLAHMAIFYIILEMVQFFVLNGEFLI